MSIVFCIYKKIVKYNLLYPNHNARRFKVLCISDELFFLLPVIVYTIFYILSFFKKSPQTIKFIRIIKYDRKFIRRVYYLFNLAWFITFSIRYYNDIKDMAFVFHDSNFGGIINIVLLLTIFFLFSLFWDMVFISCRSISSLTFKGVTITTDDIEK